MMLIEIIDSKTRDVDIVLTLMLIPRIKNQEIHLILTFTNESLFDHLKSCILNSTNIHSVYLRVNHLNKTGIVLVSDIIRSNLPKLKRLYVTCKDETIRNLQYKGLLEESLMVNNTLKELTIPQPVLPEPSFCYMFMEKLTYLNGEELNVINKELHLLFIKIFHLGVSFIWIRSFLNFYRQSGN